MNPTSLLWFSRDRAAALLIILFSGLIFSCEKDPEPMIENSSITGYVNIRDAIYGEYPQIKVTASGPYGSLSTNTDNNGAFWFRNVGNGTYDLECTLDGYGIVRKYGVQVFGNDTAWAYFTEMIPLPPENLRLPELTGVRIESENMFVDNNGTNCGDDATSVRFFFSTDEQVSNENFLYTTFANLGLYCQIQFYADLTYAFNSGDKIYMVGYISGNNDQGYMDMHRGIQVFPTLNEESRSNVISFNMP